jgi:predicted Fe-Mo cluster-binding NifX family protein
MKVCVTAKAEGLTAQVDPTFGRAAYFVFADTDSLESDSPAVESVVNDPGAHGAGVQASQLVAQKGAEAVITGSVGPNAYQGLSAAGIEMYTGATGTVKQALDDFQGGKLKLTGEATGTRHGGGGRRRF